MTKEFRQLSLQAKMSSIFILVNLVVFAVTVILILGINSMSSEIDMVCLLYTSPSPRDRG